MDETQEQDQTVEAQDVPEAPEVDQTSTENDGGFDPDRFKETLSKKNRENENLRKRLKEYEDANKTELQRIQDEAESFKGRASTAESELSRLRTAIERAPEGTDIERILAVSKRAAGDDEEALAADVDELFGLLAPKKTPNTKPKEKLRGGGDPEEPPLDMNPQSLASRIRRY